MLDGGIMAGVDLVSVKGIVGHRDIQTTLRYTHLAPGHLQGAVNRGNLSLRIWPVLPASEAKQ